MKKGFTLLELMIAIVVIAIIVAIVVPQYANYKKRTTEKAQKVDMYGDVVPKGVKYETKGLEFTKIYPNTQFPAPENVAFGIYTTCIDGYKFIITIDTAYRAKLTQIIDDKGNGIVCQQ